MAEWFKDWFNTPYYHILYKNRNYTEAEEFIRHLMKHLELNEDAEILDLACGSGRHSIHLNQLGYNVLGLDLSPSNIEMAKKYENDGLTFRVHDMRKPIAGEKFDAVLNLFTSMGYFDDSQEDLEMLTSIETYLKADGYLIIDFLNVRKAVNNLRPHQIREIDGISFDIKKRLENGFIKKEIRFVADGQQHIYLEKVRAIELEEFETLLSKASLKIKDTFGDYNLSTFDPLNSDRLIIKAIKK